MAGSPAASILVLCHNRWPETRRCLESLRRTTPADYELLVYDNASGDGTSERLRLWSKRWPQLRVFRNPRNLSFAAAVNRGMRAARADSIIWLNNDTVLTRGWLEGLLAVASAREVGGVGPMTDHMAPPAQLTKSFPNRRRPAWHEEPFLGGFCFLLKRRAFEAVGRLDERFEWGWEDIDYCLRLRQTGWRLALASNVFVHHSGNRTIRGMDWTRRQRSDRRNRRLILTKWNYVEPYGGELRRLFDRVRAPLADVRPQVTEVPLEYEGSRGLAALNESLRHAPGDFLLLSRPGRSLRASDIARLLRAARSQKNAGIVGFSRGNSSPERYVEPEDALIVRGAFHRVGEIDAVLDWRLAWADLCLRMLQAGFQILSVPGARGRRPTIGGARPRSGQPERLRSRWLSGEWISEPFQDGFWREAAGFSLRPRVSLALLYRADPLRAKRRLEALRHDASTIDCEVFLADASRSWRAAAQQSFDRSLGDYVALVDEDVRPVRGWLENLLRAAQRAENVGAAGPFFDRPVSAGQRGKVRRRVDSVRSVSALSPLCVVVPKRVADRIGRFDERFDGSAAWTDFTMRLLHEGFQLMAAEGAFARYQPRRPTASESRKESAERARFFEKWGGHPLISSRIG